MLATETPSSLLEKKIKIFCAPSTLPFYRQATNEFVQDFNAITSDLETIPSMLSVLNEALTSRPVTLAQEAGEAEAKHSTEPRFPAFDKKTSLPPEITEWLKSEDAFKINAANLVARVFDSMDECARKQYLIYHTPFHALEVATDAIIYANQIGLDPIWYPVLFYAGLAHDACFGEGRVTDEENSAKMLAATLKPFFDNLPDEASKEQFNALFRVLIVGGTLPVCYSDKSDGGDIAPNMYMVALAEVLEKQGLLDNTPGKEALLKACVAIALGDVHRSSNRSLLETFRTGMYRGSATSSPMPKFELLLEDLLVGHPNCIREGYGLRVLTYDDLATKRALIAAHASDTDPEREKTINEAIDIAINRACGINVFFEVKPTDRAPIIAAIKAGTDIFTATQELVARAWGRNNNALGEAQQAIWTTIADHHDKSEDILHDITRSIEVVFGQNARFSTENFIKLVAAATEGSRDVAAETLMRKISSALRADDIHEIDALTFDQKEIDLLIKLFKGEATFALTLSKSSNQATDFAQQLRTLENFDPNSWGWCAATHIRVIIFLHNERHSLEDKIALLKEIFRNAYLQDGRLLDPSKALEMTRPHVDVSLAATTADAATQTEFPCADMATQTGPTPLHITPPHAPTGPKSARAGSGISARRARHDAAAPTTPARPAAAAAPATESKPRKELPPLRLGGRHSRASAGIAGLVQRLRHNAKIHRTDATPQSARQAPQPPWHPAGRH